MNRPRTDRDWRRALVYGLGVSGVAAARLLRTHGVEVVGVDRRALGELDLDGLDSDRGFRALVGREPEELPAGVDGVVVSPGVPPERPLLAAARRTGVPVIAEVELAFGYLNGPVVGVTGSNGKSTTTALTGSLLATAGFEVEVCGNIGRPLSACVPGPDGRIFVTELSSFQLEGILSFRPQAAALLNIAADHLDRHADLAAYAAAKRAIFTHQDEGCVAVLNADDPLVAGVGTRARRRLFSRRGPVADGCYLEGEEVVEVTPGEPASALFRAGDLRLSGLHNLENAMAAALLARAVGAQASALAPGLTAFRGLPHRLELVADRDGVCWYDDSKGTNIAATLGSLAGFRDGTVHLILGGRSKGADPRGLLSAVRSKARRVYLIGEAAAEFGRVLSESVPCEHSGTLDRAVAAAAERAVRGEVVLLSPACASFDQFRDFNERGEQFQSLVAALDGESDGEEAGV